MQNRAINDIEVEKRRQIKLINESMNYPSIDLEFSRFNYSADKICKEYEVPSENRATMLRSVAFTRGRLSFAHLAVKELSDIISASNDVDRREEIVQLAAVCVQWIESLDRNAERLRQERAKL